MVGQNSEALALCQRILAGTDVPDEDRRRIAANRDFCARRLIETDAGEKYV
jgi:hypothetical protein